MTVGTCSMVITFALTFVMLVFPNQVFGAFTKDQSVLAISHMIIWPVILNFFGAATRSISFSLINGSGNTKLNLLVAIIDGIMGRIGLAALLGFGFSLGCSGFWYGDAIAGFVPIIIGMTFFWSGRWRTKR